MANRPQYGLSFFDRRLSGLSGNSFESQSQQSLPLPSRSQYPGYPHFRSSVVDFKDNSGPETSLFIDPQKKGSLHDESSLMEEIRRGTIVLDQDDVAFGGSCLRFYRHWQVCREFVDRTGLKHAFPFILLLVYSVIGATAFFYIEHYQEDQNYENWRNNKSLSDKNLSEQQKNLLLLLWEIHVEGKEYNHNQSWMISAFGDAYDVFDHVREALKVQDEPRKVWDKYYKALFYAGTVYTTIGYGTVYPKTVNGKIATIIYSLFGVPVMFLVLHKLGRLFCLLILRFWEFYSYFKSRFYRTNKSAKHGIRRQGVEDGDDTGDEDGDELETRHLYDVPVTLAVAITIYMLQGVEDGDDTGDEDGDELETRHLYDVPVTLAVAITLAWMLLSSAIFLFLEEKWNYFQAFYFCFISLTTIGFGDMIPSRLDYMVMVFGVVIIGLSLVTMCINLIQVKLEHIFQETVLMILKKYQEAQAAGHELNLPGGATMGVLNLLQNNKSSSWLKGFLGRNKKEELVKELQSRAQMRTKLVQTDPLSVNEKSAQVTTTMVSPPMLMKRDRGTSSDFSGPDYASIPESYMTHYFVSEEPFESMESTTDILTPVAYPEFPTVNVGQEHTLPMLLKSAEMPAKIYEANRHRMSLVSSFSDPNYVRHQPVEASTMTAATSSQSAKERWAELMNSVKRHKLDEFTEIKSEIDKILSDCRTLVTAKDPRIPGYVPQLCPTRRHPGSSTSQTSLVDTDFRSRSLATKKASAPSAVQQPSVMPSYVRRISVLPHIDSNENPFSHPSSIGSGTSYYTPPDRIRSPAVDTDSNSNV